MSDPIKHECGIVMLRLLKPLEYYQSKYGSAFYGVNKMFLLMQKQHNRGQDGAGLATLKLDMEPGNQYINLKRSVASQPIQDIFDGINTKINNVITKVPKKAKRIDWLKRKLDHVGELYLGHLRYGTYGKNNVENCHPFHRSSNWMTRNLLLAGNFNMTNVDELFQQLLSLGQHPTKKADTVTILERIGHFLDEENDHVYFSNKEKGFTKQEMTDVISEQLDIQQILRRSSKKWDGGYTIGGLIGHGDAFVMRDPAGIRPAYFYKDDEVVVVTSERPVIQTAFNVPFESIQEINPGHALIIRKNGEVSQQEINPAVDRKSCSFERIYFSRGNDQEIYQERLELGRQLVPKVLKAIDNDLDNTVFSFIPNTAEVAFYGLVQGLNTWMNKEKAIQIAELGEHADPAKVEKILARQVRSEKVAIKDMKLRTFITEDTSRDDLVAHVYDISYGTVTSTDNLVVLDDSIVRGTTLKNSIIRMLDRLNPKRIIVVSSAPQIRYPDCYGIDMAKMGDFIAFQAAVELLKERGQHERLLEIKNLARIEGKKSITKDIVNAVKGVYESFSDEEISDKIAQLITTPEINAEVSVIYQNVEALHKACPKNAGDWYFTGDYPTPGGMRVVNQAFMNFMSGVNRRAY